MQTVKQIERLWTGRRYDALLRELTLCRADAEFIPLIQNSSLALPAAAMGMVRLDELSQAGAPIYHKLLVCLLAAQDSDGGWGDPVMTALCLRAMLGSRGGGEAIERGLTYLANLQKEEGIWPKIPFRRMPADSLTSAVILYQLSHEPRFRDAVSFDDAVQWFDDHATQLDPATRKLWFSVRLRCGISRDQKAELWTFAS
jgi:hypothetical protein